ncbi:efflux transporter outer membrane subunit [Sphaerotilus sp.]|uniref:efflux transporter outer membrane subunit n=1 Tax=Sphaerotilus sp. TaxID=2093942 RepID=UPI002ACE2462|nr:efflux transporter outer membrane subunit [Sphaerotilus sp.]MDZ7857506.1 efflux transporter outer membrane subunit [Sphaerotilus sp.]
MNSPATNPTLQPRPVGRSGPALSQAWLVASLVLPTAALAGPTAANTVAPFDYSTQPGTAPSQLEPASAPATPPVLDEAAQHAARAAWWAQLETDELPGLVEAALRASPVVASARGRIERARAERVAADAAWMPLVMGSANASRGKTDLKLPLSQVSNSGVQASWELDLFGAGRAGSAAQHSRLASAEQALDAMRLSVAAETGQSYVSLRACEAQRALAELELKSHDITVRVSESAADAGFFSSEQPALARAAAAQALALLRARDMQCQRLLQSLVTLTALEEAELRQRLARRTGQLPSPAGTVPEQLPADLLMRRPDLREAAYAVMAAGYDETAARAQQWPTLSLQGAVGNSRFSTPQVTFSGQVWSFGPLQITLPIFDAGVRKARVLAAEASQIEARTVYLAKVRQAAEEVENTLAALHNTRPRELFARQSSLGYGMALAAAEQRLQGGLSSVLEVEQIRRAATQARANVIELQQTRANAWISLYRVMGGSW